jgi:hypothetical protein
LPSNQKFSINIFDSSGKMEANAISPEEIDIFVQSLRKHEVGEIGSKRWLEAHENLLKLSQQTIIEAAAYREEVVKELLVVHSKLPILIHEAYCILVWRLKVLPKILDKQEDKLNGFFLIYTILFHEVNAINLLEIVLYHENSCESLGDVVLDLIDYSVQGVTHLIGLMHASYNEKIVEASKEPKDREDLEVQQNDIAFNIGMKCITILSYLSDKVSVLSVSASRRMVTTHDLPCLLSELLSLRPWMRRLNGFQKYNDGKWETVAGDEVMRVTKTEAQTWFCLRNLMFHRETFENYEINSFRQRELGKCSGLLNENLLDQLPPLAELKHYLCTLQLSGNTSNNLNNLILEVIPDVSDFILQKCPICRRKPVDR